MEVAQNEQVIIDEVVNGAIRPSYDNSAKPIVTGFQNHDVAIAASNNKCKSYIAVDLILTLRILCLKVFALCYC
jgi:hypothetical protein